MLNLGYTDPNTSLKNVRETVKSHISNGLTLVAAPVCDLLHRGLSYINPNKIKKSWGLVNLSNILELT